MRRNVIRMAGLYLVSAWLVVQVGATLLPIFDAPPWTMKALVITLAVAFFPSLALAWVFKLTPQGLQRDHSDPSPGSVAPHTARKLDRAIIAVLALALGYFAFDKFVLSPRREAALVAETTRAAESRAANRPVARGNSIAVLPLVNASGDASQQFFLAHAVEGDVVFLLGGIGGGYRIRLVGDLRRGGRFRLVDFDVLLQRVDEILFEIGGRQRSVGNLAQRSHGGLVVALDERLRPPLG